jgi:hypothetical protein
MRRLVLALMWLVLPSALLGTTAQRSELSVTLKFLPQASIRTNSVALPASLIDRSLEIRVQDSREQTDPRIVGTGTNDDDETFSIRATTDVAPFVGEAVTQLATAQALKKGSPADRVLQLRLTRFAVNESNKALGSTYSAEVHFAFTLLDAASKTLAQGASSGVANRYGRARSGANCAEVLSDALKEAFTNTIADPGLQQAWASGQPSSPASQAPAPAGTGTVEERLKRLDDLMKKGVITKEEHATQRAAILREL